MEQQKKNRKLIILYILKMFEEGSSKEKPITQSSILKTLTWLGFSINRKTVASYVDALIEFGYDIVKISGGGCYLNKGE